MSEEIKLRIEPSGGDTAKLDATDFVQQFEALLKAIAEVGAAIDGQKSDNITYRIEELSTNSPATAGIVPELKFGAEYVNYEPWHTALYDGLQAIRNGVSEVPAAITARCVEWLRKLARPIGERVHRGTLFIGTREFVLDYEFKKQLQVLDASDRVERRGFMKGLVERMNIHRDNRVFTLYPFVGPESVQCRFTAKDKEQAKACFGKYVRVHGDLKYHWREKWPFEISVSSIEIVDEEGIPTFSQMWNSLPEITGDKKSEEFIEEIRNE